MSKGIPYFCLTFNIYLHKSVNDTYGQQYLYHFAHLNSKNFEKVYVTLVLLIPIVLVDNNHMSELELTILRGGVILYCLLARLASHNSDDLQVCLKTVFIFGEAVKLFSLEDISKEVFLNALNLFYCCIYTFISRFLKCYNCKIQ